MGRHLSFTATKIGIKIDPYKCFVLKRYAETEVDKVKPVYVGAVIGRPE